MAKIDDSRKDLIKRIKEFCAEHEIAETRFGREAVNNPNIVDRIKDGKPMLDTSIKRINDFMRDYRPATDGKHRPKQEAIPA